MPPSSTRLRESDVGYAPQLTHGERIDWKRRRLVEGHPSQVATSLVHRTALEALDCMARDPVLLVGEQSTCPGIGRINLQGIRKHVGSSLNLLGFVFILDL